MDGYPSLGRSYNQADDAATRTPVRLPMFNIFMVTQENRDQKAWKKN